MCVCLQIALQQENDDSRRQRQFPVIRQGKKERVNHRENNILAHSQEKSRRASAKKSTCTVVNASQLQGALSFFSNNSTSSLSLCCYIMHPSRYLTLTHLLLSLFTPPPFVSLLLFLAPLPAVSPLSPFLSLRLGFLLSVGSSTHWRKRKRRGGEEEKKERKEEGRKARMTNKMGRNRTRDQGL